MFVDTENLGVSALTYCMLHALLFMESEQVQGVGCQRLSQPLRMTVRSEVTLGIRMVKGDVRLWAAVELCFPGRGGGGVGALTVSVLSHCTPQPTRLLSSGLIQSEWPLWMIFFSK